MSDGVWIEPAKRISFIPATILDGPSGLSAAINLRGFVPKGILMPAAWGAASVTFQAAEAEAGTYQDLYDSAGTEVSVTVAGGRAVGFSTAVQDLLAGVAFVKLRSGTTAVPVNQGANRALILVGAASTR